MDRPVWLRVAVQVALLFVAGVLLPRLLSLQSMLTPLVDQSAMRLGLGMIGRLILMAFAGVPPALLSGATATVLTWLLVRKPWDALANAAYQAVVIVVLEITFQSGGDKSWWLLAGDVVWVLSVFGGTALTACWLQRRMARRRTVPAVAQLP
ncbi:MAG: hypothetical protein WCP21_01590 [Armatimonadota bacterium]